MILGYWHTDTYIAICVSISNAETDKTPKLGQVGLHRGDCRDVRTKANSCPLSHDARLLDTEQQYYTAVGKVDWRLAPVPAPFPGVLDERLQRGHRGDPLVTVQLDILQILHSHHCCGFSILQQGVLPQNTIDCCLECSSANRRLS